MRKNAKLPLLREWLAAHKPEVVDPPTRDRIAGALAPISPAHLRRVLIASGAKLHPLVEGVRQDSYDEAERTLCALSGLYPAEPRQTRRLVIEAKDHARLALTRHVSAPETGSRRREIIEWMVVWVNDPALFPAWVRLRRRAATAPRSSEPG